MQSVCSEAIIEELDKLLERLHIPSEVCLNSVSLQLQKIVYCNLILSNKMFSNILYAIV